MTALFITIFSGLFFLIGALITIFSKKKKGIVEFSIGMAFIVMILLLSLDIVPESFELLGKDKKYFFYIFVIIGIIILKLIDILVPHHNHHDNIDHHEKHLKHISTISTVAFMIHNAIEGIAVYNITLNNTKTGFVMALAVGLHNIPFGIEITAALNESKKSKWHSIISIIALTLSSIIGAVIMMTFGTIDNFVLGGLMSLTVGMVIYLILFELLVEIINSDNKKITILGFITGLIIIILTSIIGG